MMTVISTLLLQVFGLDPKNKNINSKKITKDINNSDLTETDMVKSQQLSDINNTRIDRDKLRPQFYDNVDRYFGLSYDKKHAYDLSNNPVKYNIVDNLINNFGEYSFVKNIINSDLFNKIFSNAIRSNSNLYKDYNEIRNYSNLEELNLTNSFNNFNNFNRSNNRNIIESTNNNNSELKYDHLNLNSYNIYKTKAYIDSLSKYDDKFVCPSNETPITYKSKTGLDCYEICPPGKIRDSDGECRR
jgi:hypothetical protein